MSEIQRLVRVAAKRNSAKEYTTIRFRALRSLVDRFRSKAEAEGMSGNVILEAFLTGYVNSHPSVLAMIDQWIRDESKEIRERRAPKMSQREIAEIYAAAKCGLELEEETDG